MRTNFWLCSIWNTKYNTFELYDRQVQWCSSPWCCCLVVERHLVKQTPRKKVTWIAVQWMSMDAKESQDPGGMDPNVKDPGTTDAKDSQDPGGTDPNGTAAGNTVAHQDGPPKQLQYISTLVLGCMKLKTAFPDCDTREERAWSICQQMFIVNMHFSTSVVLGETQSFY